MASILIIDDEENIRSSLKSALERRGHDISLAENIAEAQKAIDDSFDVVFLDVMLPDGNGLDLLNKIRGENPEQTIVMISGHAGIDMAVEAIKAGAYDFIEKPITLDRVLVIIENAVRKRNLENEKERLSSRLYGELIGDSPEIKKLKKDIARSAPKASRFLITGENGTGKELIANLIHRSGRHDDGSFVTVNCAALPSELVESELFGHTAGAFTGAAKKRKGRFLEADKGTIFLDEIGEMPMAAQAKILRAIENNEITPVGSDQSIGIDTVLIAASNRDLSDLVKSGNFREDLFFRLNVVRFAIPPLRERKEDIPLLADYFLAKFAADSGIEPKMLQKPALEFLTVYNFPGNIRELRNLMERVNIYIDKDEVSRDDLARLMPSLGSDESVTLKESVENFERDFIRSALARNRQNVTETARSLGLERSHLYKKLRKYDLK